MEKTVKKIVRNRLWMIALMLVFITGCGSNATTSSGETTTPSTETTQTTTPSVEEETSSVDATPSVEETPSVEVTPSATTEQKNALKTAENYLKFT
ncbi:MAG: hypothetical protein ACRC3J_02470, partial [Culicoidibacterales bacterium]